MVDQQTPSWDPLDPSVQRDQRTAYDRMRQECPVAHSDALGWSVFGHEDAARVVADPTTFSSATRRLAIPNGMDPPDHTAYRAALERFFAPDRARAFERTSRTIAEAVLAPSLEHGEMDAVEDFGDPFAHQVLCAFMGWPVEDWNRIRGWTHGNLEAAFRRDRELGARVAHEFGEYVTAITQARRADPVPDDLMTELTRVTVRGEGLTDEQIVATLRTWTAGHGTVASAIGIVIHHLSNDIELQARLRLQTDLVEAAVREILRADGPLVANARTTTRDVELGGYAIPAGERVSLMWIAADRDPSVFTDPDRVNVDRSHDLDLLFGAGIHRCLGESLAVMEVRTVVQALLGATDRFELLAPDTPARSTYPSNGLRSLPLRMRPGAMRSTAP